MRSLLTALIFSPWLAAHAAPEIQPGSWSVTTSVSMPGMKTQPVTVTHCVTPEQAKMPADTMGQMNEQLKQQQCKMLDQKMTASTFTYRMECNGQIKMTAQGDFSFTPNSYMGTLITTADGGIKINSDISGKRLGACKS